MGETVTGGWLEAACGGSWFWGKHCCCLPGEAHMSPQGGQQPCALVHLGRAGEFLCLSPQAPNPTFHNAEPLGKTTGRCCPQGCVCRWAVLMSRSPRAICSATLGSSQSGMGAGVWALRGEVSLPREGAEKAPETAAAGWAVPCSFVHQPLGVGVCVPASAAPASTQCVRFRECDAATHTASDPKQGHM